jgi:hypothetical protein
LHTLRLFGVQTAQKLRLFPIDLAAHFSQRRFIFGDLCVGGFQTILGSFAGTFGQAKTLRQNLFKGLQIKIADTNCKNPD